MQEKCQEESAKNDFQYLVPKFVGYQFGRTVWTLLNPALSITIRYDTVR